MPNEEFSEEFKQSLKEDQLNVDKSMDLLIDVVSKFKSSQGIENLSTDDWAEMLTALDFGKFIISGIMYSYGMDLHVTHSTPEEDEEE